MGLPRYFIDIIYKHNFQKESKTMKKSKKLLLISLVMIVLMIGVGALIVNHFFDDTFDGEIPLTDLAATYKGEIKDEDGNLLVPFDVAYPDEFATGAYKYNEDVLLLKLKNNFKGKLTTNLKNCGFAAIEKFLDTNNGDWYRATLTDGADIITSIMKARSLSEVLVADFDYIYETEAIDYANSLVNLDEAVADDAGFVCDEKVKENQQWKDQYHLGKNDLQKAWKYLEANGVPAGGSSSVIVAVIDTGVDYTHPDLKANIWVNTGEIPDNGRDDDGNGYVDDVYGWDAIANNGDPMDDHGHGTHVAGIIAASNNKEGVVGIAYNVKIMPIKAGQATGVFNQSDIAEAIIYAYEMGADVINMSFGGSACSVAVQDALTTAYTTATLVASAGNDGYPNEAIGNWPPLPNYPAALSYVIGVMSVDRNGVESGFTNWDAYTFNKVEYEVYAPGEQILSTLPDGRYGKLSGTSMAAPIVSAAAALLRSYFTDRDMYPSKFIAAQICATSQDTATCIDPKVHGKHNIPMILNINDALTKLPKPDIQVYDFYFFDPAEYNGVEYPENNGDGVADAGETLLVGLVLRNRWGMSKETVVTIDALSSGGVANPYVEIIDGEVNFEGIGTYSTKSTLVYNEQNIITGITDPIIVKISKDCPNDYLIGLNVYMTYKNALDEKDTAEYTYGEAGSYEVSFWARNGVILPSQITEDMTLTKDNYYIIPNSAYIYEGVTVTVEPGTKIQFWSDDPNDPYADTYIAYLNVAGSFICQGTEDEPIQLFPSEMMSHYIVDIRQTGSAVVNLSYTTVTNPIVELDDVDHCTFKYNYNNNYLYYRTLSEGKVYSSNTGGAVVADTVENSLFYKCGDYNKLHLLGQYEGCSFVDSNIVFETTNTHAWVRGVAVYGTSASFSNCVFMGNNNGTGYVSSMTLSNILSTGVNKVVRDPLTGTTYISVAYNNDGSVAALDIVREIAKAWGGDIACLETKEEWDFVNTYFNAYDNGIWNDYGIGIANEDSTTWVNGEALGNFVPKASEGGDSTATLYTNNHPSDNKLWFCYIPDYYILEIPGSIYVDTIYLRDNEVKIDDESTYQIVAGTIPATFDKSQLIYVSEDENIATISSNGLVTPVSEGTTRIFVYSPDYLAYAVMKISVVEKVAVVDVKFDNMIIELGGSAEIIPTYTPANTTERALTYVSADTTIATVNEYGVVTATGIGTTTITVTAQNGTTDEISIKVMSKVESLTYADNFYITYLGDTDEGWKPSVYPSYATDYTIVYSSSDKNVAYVDDEGNLVRASVGIATLRAEIAGTNLYAEVQISVNETPFETSKVVSVDYYDNSILAVTDDGSLWVWGQGYHSGYCCGSSGYWHNAYVRVPTKIADGVKSAVFGQFDSYSSGDRQCYISYVNTDGELYEAFVIWSTSDTTADTYKSSDSLSGLKSIYRYGDSFYALTEDGRVWVAGSNDYGQLGVGTRTDISTPALSGITGVKEIAPFVGSVAFLKDNGELYIAGTSTLRYSNPHKIDSGVVDIRAEEMYNVVYEKNDGYQYYYHYNYSDDISSRLSHPTSDRVYMTSGNNCSQVYFENGNVYCDGALVSGVKNPVDFFFCDGSYYVLTEDGSLYGFGNNDYYQLADLTQTNRYSEAKKIFFGVGSDDEDLTYDSSNVTDGILSEESLVVDYNRAILIGSGYPNIQLNDSAGMVVYIEKSIRLDKLTIKPVDPLVNGEVYTLYIPTDAFLTAWGKYSKAQTITFTYNNDTPIEFWGSDINDGMTLTDGVLSGELEYSFAVEGDTFADISLVKTGDGEVALGVTLIDSILSINAEGLLPGEYVLTIPAGALKDNVGGVSDEIVYTLTVPAPEEVEYLPLAVLYSSVGAKVSGAALIPEWRIVMNKAFTLDESLVALVDSEGNAVAVNLTVSGNTLVISPKFALDPYAGYRITVSEGAVTDEAGAVVDTLESEFTTIEQYERFFWTADAFAKEYKEEVYKNAFNYKFYYNAILNNFNDTNVENWLRIMAYEGGVNDKVGLGQNWWGTTLEEMIGRQIVDFDDYQSLMDIIYAPYLTEAPSNTFPFVTQAYIINSSGERVDRVANETVTFVVEFNRDMDTTIPLRVRFGSSLPYAEYEISGEYVNARRWEGTYTLKTTIENGRQFFRIENGAAADDGYLGLYETPGRFGFEIDTTAAQALTMLGEATESGIKLTWTQDDFDTLAGYNVYRSTSEDGYYQRLNSYVIPSDVKEFFDDTVEPGKRYYYNFTVVKTDLTESTPSGKITIMSMDTMAPDIYHTPVRTGYTGSNLLISATVTDNLGINKVILHYRTVGETEWRSTEMTAHNSRYTGLVLADYLSTEGLEYYIEARDGNNSTFKGTADAPYAVIIKLAVDANSMGDVDGDGVITNKDALMLLQAANDLLNLTEDQFLRADLNSDGELSAAEALRILQYVSGKVTTITD